MSLHSNEEQILKADIKDSSAVGSPAKVLDGQAVLAVVTALCEPDRVVAEQLRRGMKSLIHSQRWATEIETLERHGLAARHYYGAARELLELPGDLALQRDAEGGFQLLHRLEQRWKYLNGSGEPLPDEVDLTDEMLVEAVIMTIPSRKGASGGFASLAALWPELRAAWAEVGIASLFINAGMLVMPIFAILVYDKIALNGLFETLWAVVFGIGLYLVTDAGMRFVRNWATERISVDLTRRSDEKLWSKLVAQVELPAGGFPRFLSNYRDLTLSRDFVSSSYLLTVADIPFLFLYLAVIGIISWPLMIAAIILVVVYSSVGLLLQARQARLSKEAEQKNTLKLSFMGEALGCLDIVRTTPGVGSFLRSWRELTEQTTDSDTRRRLGSQQMVLFSSVMQTVTTVAILSSGVYLIYSQYLSTGKLIACNLLAGRAMGLVASLFVVTGKWQDFMRSAEHMEKSLEEVEQREHTPRPEITGNIAVIGVGKHYEGRPAALESVSLSLSAGERIALLGRPGAGKSTLLRCLSGLCRPDTGQIQIDGLALEDISRFDRVKWLAYKAQEPAIFAGTLEANLRISGCLDMERFAQALWASGLESEFSSGRMSLGMSLEERGNNLSGGQRQKVALARAFAQPSKILLLDEPTLGLDPESERLLAERLPGLLTPDSLLIMTTHSPVILEIADRVVALDGGRVVADGPREKLVRISQSGKSALPK